VYSRELHNLHHARMLISNLFTLQQQGLLCDISLVSNGGEILAHRVVLAACSKYFEAMFTNGMQEADKRQISMKNIDKDSLANLIDYSYTGILFINDMNVQTLLETADLLQFQTAKALCCEYIKDQMNVNNCLEIYQFAEIYNCDDIMELAQDIFNKSWKKVIETDHFLLLDYDLLLKLLSNDLLEVHREFDVFDIIITWVNANLNNRYHFLISLLELVRWEFIEPNQLDMIMSIPIISSNKITSNFVQSCMESDELNARLDDMRFSYSSWVYILGGEQSFLREMKSCEFFNYSSSNWEYGFSLHGPRTSFAAVVQGDNLYVIGGMRFGEKLKLVECYNPKNGRWKRLASLKKCLGDVEAAIIDDVVYAAGGSSEGEPASRYAEKYDESNNIWISVAHMKSRRRRFGLCSYASKLYVFGGFQDSAGELRSCECYDPDSNTWESMSPMQTSRCDLGVALLSGFIYVAGGVNSYSGSIAKVEKYNPCNDTWLSCDPLVHARGGHAMITYMGRIFAIGGMNSYMQTCRDAEWFNEVTGQWSNLPSTNMPRFGGVAIVLPYRRRPKTVQDGDDGSNENS